ncbi:MAG: hypothetical protein EXR76_12410 [Myxococcales bacterium]|nr:hypothetical protein [Myxococcales bacterium]
MLQFAEAYRSAPHFRSTTRRSTGRAEAHPHACGLPVDTGPCDGAFERWYFDPATGDCASFSFGGCRGNANNFETLRACVATCDNRVVCPDATDPNVRYTSMDPQFCARARIVCPAGQQFFSLPECECGRIGPDPVAGCP